jgi:hypothetical protein
VNPGSHPAVVGAMAAVTTVATSGPMQFIRHINGVVEFQGLLLIDASIVEELRDRIMSLDRWRRGSFPFWTPRASRADGSRRPIFAIFAGSTVFAIVPFDAHAIFARRTIFTSIPFRATNRIPFGSSRADFAFLPGLPARCFELGPETGFFVRRCFFRDKFRFRDEHRMVAALGRRVENIVAFVVGHPHFERFQMQTGPVGPFGARNSFGAIPPIFSGGSLFASWTNLPFRTGSTRLSSDTITSSRARGATQGARLDLLLQRLDDRFQGVDLFLENSVCALQAGIVGSEGVDVASHSGGIGVVLDFHCHGHHPMVSHT